MKFLQSLIASLMLMVMVVVAILIAMTLLPYILATLFVLIIWDGVHQLLNKDNP